MLKRTMIACFALVVASTLSACATSAPIERVIYTPSQCVGERPLVFEGCELGEVPEITTLPGGGMVSSCTVLTRDDLQAVAEYNGGYYARCEFQP